MIEPGRQRQADVSDDLRPELQRRDGLAPAGIMQLRSKWRSRFHLVIMPMIVTPNAIRIISMIIMVRIISAVVIIYLLE